MKKIITLTLILFLTYFASFAQSKTLDNITSFSLRNSGSILNDNENIEGYYFFYKVDKLKKGKREFAIQILDKDLNVIATKSIIGGKYMNLVSSDYNNKEIAFVFSDFKERKFRYVTFDKKGNQAQDIDIPMSKKSFKWLSYMNASTGFNELLLPVKNKGFILNLVEKEGKLGYKMTFYPSSKSISSWTYTSPEDSKEMHLIKPIKVTENYVISLLSKQKGMMSTKNATSELVVFDTNTGKIVFKKDILNGENPKMVTNAFENNGEIVILGEYFKKDAKIYKAKSLGLFLDTYNETGQEIVSKKLSWNNKLIKDLGLNGKSRNYVYFHEIVKTKSGEFVAIGEQYKRTASAGGIAMAALSRGSGAVTQLTITDAVIFKFDKEFNLTAVKKFAKGKSRAPSITDFGSPQLNAHILKQMGAFDFEFLQMDPNRNRFYANYIDYVREGKHKGERAFKSIIYNDGELSEDKIYLKKDKIKLKFRIYPAKLGHVLIVEHNKKAKTIDLHLEKLNVE